MKVGQEEVKIEVTNALQNMEEKLIKRQEKQLSNKKKQNRKVEALDNKTDEEIKTTYKFWTTN